MNAQPRNRASRSRLRALSAALVVVTTSAGAARAQTASPPAGAPPAAPEAAPPAPPPALAAPPPAVAPAMPTETGVIASLYGFVELDMMHDSTQSFTEAITNSMMARPGTLAGDNPRTQFTARDSRVGLALAAPAYGSIRTSARVEVDFFGNQAPGATEDATYSAAALRLRHALVKFETPVLDVLAGHTNDLFAWGGAGFYPNTVGFLGVPGEIYHRDPQLRLSKVLSGSSVTFEMAAAAVRPAQRDAEIPDGQGGLRIAFERWRGTSAQGAGLPKAAPASLGVSGIYRRFSVPAFTASQANPNKANGWGAAVNLFLPIIPASSPADLGNTLSATAEATIGTGISNLYTGLTGGVAFPALPNPSMLLPVPVYSGDIDPGLVTYDANGKLRTVSWRALVLCLQYRAPFGMGRKLGLSAVASQLESTNIVALTPMQGLSQVFSKAQYVDGNVFFSPTPQSQIGASVQLERQTFGDVVTYADAAGNVSSHNVYGNNVRGELAVYYFF
ncbi:MAG TPA: hypothetical protein VHL80_15615 [Polyangia bacterium]|nr:hypothetical protein [Polyangia bacterium]